MVVHGLDVDARASAGTLAWYPLVVIQLRCNGLKEIVTIAKETTPGIKTFSLPQGLQVEKGPDAVVEHIKENLPALLES